VGGLNRLPLDDAVVWHDVECAAYEADLALWERLAAKCPGPVLDLGAGTGRVALHLVERGHAVTALDSDPALVGALATRARGRGLRLTALTADIRSFDLGERRFGLAVAPMQVFQLLGSSAGREAALAAVHAHLEHGGVLAIALADPFEGVPAEVALPPLPDIREQDGWVFQSTPVGLRSVAGATNIERVRHAVAPDGALHESIAVIRLDVVRPAELERAAAALGYCVLAREQVPETEAYVGSAVVKLEAT